MKSLPRQRSVERQLEIYEEESRQESWNQEHNAAMRCFEFEGVLAHALSVLDLIHRIDEGWRAKVLQGAIEADPEVDHAIENLYRRWLKPCHRVLSDLKLLEADFEVRHADEFRKAQREVEGILTPDDRFFAAEKLIDLRDQALDQNERGETQEFQELGN